MRTYNAPAPRRSSAQGYWFNAFENVYALQVKIHTVNLHHVQDKYYRLTRQLLLRLLEGNSLRQVTLYNVWLSDNNLRNIISICAGLPTKEPPQIEREVT